jgi:hypothetical protein
MMSASCLMTIQLMMDDPSGHHLAADAGMASASRQMTIQLRM